MRTTPRVAILVAGAWLAPAETLRAETPPAPDYAEVQAWAALPGQPGGAEETPAGVAPGDRRERERVDVFFIHPTTYLAASVGNARFDEPGETRARIESGVLRFQASVFNGCCRIFAPRYRQGSLAAMTHAEPEAFAAIEVAYGDVLRAFDDFIAQRSEGRPFVLASHSQGSIHAMRFLQERIIGAPLAGRMVAAYVVGSSLPRAIAQHGLPICASATATGCVVDWNTVSQGHSDARRKEKAIIWWEGHYRPVAGLPVVCVNPLSWSPDGSAPASANLGAVYSAGRGVPLPAPVPQVTGAACEETLLDVDIVARERRHFSDMLTLFGVYHDFDYNLFYMNIRRNAEERVRQFLGNARR